MDFYRFRHPFTCMIAGPSMSGKTLLVRRILEHFKDLTNIETPNLSVIWCYGQWQKLFNVNIDNVKVNYIPGLPSEEDLKTQILVLDDLMS